MTTSGIITRGYGVGQGTSTIITRGYGLLLDVIREAVEEIARPRRSGGTRARYVRQPVIKKTDYPDVDEVEFCVSVTLDSVNDVDIIDPIKGSICRKFNDIGYIVSIDDIDVKYTLNDTLKIDVRMLSLNHNVTSLHVSASLAP